MNRHRAAIAAVKLAGLVALLAGASHLASGLITAALAIPLAVWLIKTDNYIEPAHEQAARLRADDVLAATVYIAYDHPREHRAPAIKGENR